MSTLAIITARGGSKRIPMKNVKVFCGKPIISYPIYAAKESSIFDEIMVSTDNLEIAALAKEYGIKVPFLRSEKTSNDFATTSDVLKEVIEMYAKQGQYFDDICCLYPTAPFITADKLKQAYQIFKEKDADALLPVVKFSFPPQRGLSKKDDFISMIHPENLNVRSQDLEPVYHDCGQFSFIKCSEFLKNGKILMERTAAMVMDESEVQDIDTEEDWLIAEMKYQIMKRK